LKSKREFIFYFRAFSFIFVFLYITNFQVVAQSNIKLDDRLYNGKFYNYFPPKNVKGNQFLFSSDFMLSSVYLGDRKYNNLNINIDVLNQEILLKFETNEGAKRVISMSLAYLDSFIINNKVFVVNQIDSVNQRIEQEIKYNNYKFYINYYKKLELQSALNEINYYFSEVNRRITFIHKGERVEISNNKKFYKLFGKEKGLMIKHYFKNGKFKLKKMTDKELFGLLMFINNECNG